MNKAQAKSSNDLYTLFVQYDN